MTAARSPDAHVSFPADFPHIGQEVDLYGMRGAGAVSLDCRRRVPGDLTVHLLVRRQRRIALKQVRDPLRLDLGYRHDRPDGLDEPDEVQPGQLRGDYPAIEGDLLAVYADCGLTGETES